MAFPADESWVVLSPIEASIKRKIEAVGTPLREWDIHIYRGVLTGCNEAFIIPTSRRDEILAACRDEAERERTAALIRRNARHPAEPARSPTSEAVRHSNPTTADRNSAPAPASLSAPRRTGTPPQRPTIGRFRPSAARREARGECRPKTQGAHSPRVAQHGAPRAVSPPQNAHRPGSAPACCGRNDRFARCVSW